MQWDQLCKLFATDIPPKRGRVQATLPAADQTTYLRSWLETVIKLFEFFLKIQHQ